MHEAGNKEVEKQKVEKLEPTCEETQGMQQHAQTQSSATPQHDGGMRCCHLRGRYEGDRQDTACEYLSVG